MRAKVAGVALVTCGILGIGAVAAPGAAFADRGKNGHGGGGHDGGGHDGGGHDNGQQDNTYDHSCTSNDHAVIGNVCVMVDDLPILGTILSATDD